MKVILKFLTLLCLTVPTAAFAQSNIYWEGDGWTVFRQESSCTIGYSSVPNYVGGLYFLVDYSVEEKSLHLMFTTKATKSLGDRGQFEADLIFAGAGVDDGVWRKQSFTYFKEGDEYNFSFVVQGDDNVNRLLKDITENTIVAVAKNEKIFAGSRLSGSVPAIKKLRECAFTVDSLSPSDPFAQ